MSDDLVAFWSARLDEDKDRARRGSPPGWVWGNRALREVAAKRRILTRYEYACRQASVNIDAEQEAWEKIAGALERDALDLAAVYSDHPDYREEWKPGEAT